MKQLPVEYDNNSSISSNYPNNIKQLEDELAKKSQEIRKNIAEVSLIIAEFWFRQDELPKQTQFFQKLALITGFSEKYVRELLNIGKMLMFLEEPYKYFGENKNLAVLKALVHKEDELRNRIIQIICDYFIELTPDEIRSITWEDIDSVEKDPNKLKELLEQKITEKPDRIVHFQITESTLDEKPYGKAKIKNKQIVWMSFEKKPDEKQIKWLSAMLEKWSK